MVAYRKKLIEVALPLEAINKASAREKEPFTRNHPRSLHIWWARRPLAAARAVIFAQMVDDPSAHPDEFPTEEAQEKERQRLFRLIEGLVQWENTTNETVLAQAREEIWKSWRRTCEEHAARGMEQGDASRSSLPASSLFNPDKLPAFHDPFAGGGSLPLEAQRLGLESYASDLNPVAVLINKAMIEIPPKFAGRAPVNPEARKEKSLIAKTWRGAQGLAEDVRYYGKWMRDEAEKRIGHLYPKIEITADMAKERSDLKSLVGRKLTVIAWLWARTVKSPNPAFAQVDVPLASTFMLSTKAGKEAYVEPILIPSPPAGEGKGEGEVGYRFTVKVGKPKDAEAAKNGTKLARGANFKCLMSNSPISGDYIKAEGQAGRMGARLMAIVAEGDRGRLYFAPPPEHESVARQAQPTWIPSGDVPARLTGGTCVPYGMREWGDLFTPRQLVALTTFSDLVQEAREQVKRDALASRNSSPQRGEVGRGEQWQPTPVPSTLLQAARDLRKNLTDAEPTLWQCLRGKQLAGYRFRKQHPLGRYVLDFYCPSAKVAIELDGGQHNTEAGKARDTERTAFLTQQGIQVLRFWNHEVFDNLEGVLGRIGECLRSVVPPPQPSPAGGGSEEHPPLLGGDWEEENVSLAEGLPDDGCGLDADGAGVQAYADAVAVYLTTSTSRWSDLSNSLCSWNMANQNVRALFTRQAIPMCWDYVELSPFSNMGSWFSSVESAVALAVSLAPETYGEARQLDAASQSLSLNRVVSTDPPYYDNIGYADLSDFFYVWLRHSLKPVLPNLFTTLAVPKAEELVATPYRHGSKEKAETFFLDGMTRAIRRLAEQAHPAFPVSIYYAFKQSETGSESGTSSTGWETFLDAVIRAGFAISGTWPIRTERGARSIGIGTNALASSIILVCRPRPQDAPTVTRREFLTALKRELPNALAYLQRGNIAPVDLAQSAIGPGMAVFTRYTKVLDAEGKAMRVREALALINQTLDEVLAEQEGDFDVDTRWALSWFEQFGFAEGEFGVAETLSKAKNTSVAGMVDAGIAASRGGKVRLLKPDELPRNWDPTADTRLTVWEMVHHLVHALEQGETAAAELVAQLGTKADTARELAYRLYTVCERKKRAQEALSYNALVQSWPEIVKLAGQKPELVQKELF